MDPFTFCMTIVAIIFGGFLTLSAFITWPTAFLLTILVIIGIPVIPMLVDKFSVQVSKEYKPLTKLVVVAVGWLIIIIIL